MCCSPEVSQLRRFLEAAWLISDSESPLANVVLVVDDDRHEEETDEVRCEARFGISQSNASVRFSLRFYARPHTSASARAAQCSRMQGVPDTSTP